MTLQKCIFCLQLFVFFSLVAEDSFRPYTKENLPKNATELWRDYDPAKESLDVKVVKEWKSEGVVTRYITFTVGTFKGTASRIAAYYTFPDNGQRNPAFVWSHGGGQRAERQRGIYFAKQGYATVDINWLGREMEKEIEENTDWGKVDPTQGPLFYPKALRKSWKMGFEPDEHSIDSIYSPRNSNWFLLAVAGRRAISFLELQPEVDKEKLGFAGFSMGGMITSFNAVDKRLKAVVPFVGGTGFKYEDLPGITRSSLAHVHKDLELYKNTMDSSAYWPLVDCPVMFITSSNDFHSTFERIYKSMNLLKHSNWRVASNIHANHGPDPEQWILLNKWFDHYLKGNGPALPATPDSTFKVSDELSEFTVSPEEIEKVINTEIYYSYDPNSRTRFWQKAEAVQKGNSWTAKIKVHKNLPLYTFAICRYKLAEKAEARYGTADTFTLNSKEHIYMPEDFDSAALKNIKSKETIVDDFSKGLQNWYARNNRGITTYKFQDPELNISNSQKLKLTVNSKEKDLFIIVSIEGKFLAPGSNMDNFTLVKKVPKGGSQQVILSLEDFKSNKGKKAEWSKIATFNILLKEVDARHNLTLSPDEWLEYIRKIEIID